MTDEATLVVEAALFTTWVRVAEVDPAKLGLPPYTAVTEWDPALSEDVVKVAWPLPVNVPVPMEVALSKKVTVPVGTAVFPLGPVTVAVKVTDCPPVVGLADEARAVVVAGSVAAVTACISDPDVDAAKLESPP